jgi:hypothetical protein
LAAIGFFGGFHVASMSRGAAGRLCQSLKILGKILQHTRHESGRFRTGRKERFSCVFNLVGEVGLEPTKAKPADLQSGHPLVFHLLALTRLSAVCLKNPRHIDTTREHWRTFVDNRDPLDHISVLTQC